MTNTEGAMIVIRGDYWIELWRDGKPLFQGHSIDPTSLLELLGIDYDRIDADEYGEACAGLWHHSPEDLRADMARWEAAGRPGVWEAFADSAGHVPEEADIIRWEGEGGND
jgi:hypothetical protein